MGFNIEYIILLSLLLWLLCRYIYLLLGIFRFVFSSSHISHLAPPSLSLFCPRASQPLFSRMRSSLFRFRFFFLLFSLGTCSMVVCCHRFYYSPFAIITIMRNWNSMYKRAYCYDIAVKLRLKLMLKLSLHSVRLAFDGMESDGGGVMVACAFGAHTLFSLPSLFASFYSYTYILYLYYHYNSISQPIRDTCRCLYRSLRLARLLSISYFL